VVRFAEAGFGDFFAPDFAAGAFGVGFEIGVAFIKMKRNRIFTRIYAGVIVCFCSRF